ncbi:DUF2909 family protein [Vibrio sp. SCSIO 43136]|uniref:DUF2909 family protein n=1 Tax=Vibrio sp. SCSIO 43136 TaxID=2819101 RepID=UPI00207536A6|nr:DUF2909 family protein [Vibrio sp. SCSIO 43136]USD65053.1 DUF2909 family protein [Vibrio sp. SCSIO 43136]
MSLFLFKLLLVVALFLVIINMAKALVVVVRGSSDKPASHFLGKRLIFSAAVVLVLLVALSSGWVVPNPRPY